eukprot:5827841-Amphidinium_carterae.2
MLQRAQDRVQELLDRMVERDWAEQYPSLEDLLHHHGQGCEMAPLSKLGLISIGLTGSSAL